MQLMTGNTVKAQWFASNAKQRHKARALTGVHTGHEAGCHPPSSSTANIANIGIRENTTVVYMLEQRLECV